MISEELGLPVEKLFTRSRRRRWRPRRSARCTARSLPNGKRVAVKVQRPDAPRQIEADLALLYQAAQDREGPGPCARLHRRPRARRRVRPLDPAGARLPARGAQRADVPPQLLGPSARPVPHVYWSYTRAARADARAARGHPARRHRARRRTRSRSAARLAYLMTEAWMTMIFRHGFFHGDPHPANILVLGPRADRTRRLRADREALRRRHVQADRALHRRREGERRRAAAAARRPRRPLRRAREEEFTPSCGSSTTSTTARGSPRSTRCR